MNFIDFIQYANTKYVQIVHEELQRRGSTKPIQFTVDYGGLGFNDFVVPGVKVEMSTAFHEVFERYSQIVNPKDGGEKGYAFDAHRLIESLCRIWVDLYGTITTLREQVLRDKAQLEQEVCKLLEAEERHERAHGQTGHLPSTSKDHS